MGAPLECFYDVYAEMLQETIEIFRDPDRQRAIARAQEIDSLREMVGMDPAYLYRVREPPEALLMMAAMHRKCRPYVLSAPVARLAMEMVDKAGTHVLPTEPFLSIPLWFEFEETAIGSEEEQFNQFFFYPDFDDPPGVRCDMISPGEQRVKTLVFPERGGWEYEQNGACTSSTCIYAPHTEEGVPFRVREQDHMGDCQCWGAAAPMAQLVRACNYLLKHRREPLAEEIYVREVPRPYAEPSTRREKEANSRAARASRPNIRTISLSSPVSTTRRASSRGDALPGERQLSLEKISVEGHWRVLIPGEGLPWKTFQIVPVESYQRSTGPGEGPRTRYYVEA